MDDMSKKKFYIWRLAQFLVQHNARMSVGELANNLNRNSFKTSYGSTYAGGRGTLRLIATTYQWVDRVIGLGEDEAEPIALAFVKDDGKYAWRPEEPIPAGEE